MMEAVALTRKPGALHVVRSLGVAMVGTSLLSLVYLASGSETLLLWSPLVVGVLIAFVAHSVGPSALLCVSLGGWFVAALLRRLIDWSLGSYTPLSPVVLLPLALSVPALLIGAWGLVQARSTALQPYRLVALAILYGAAVGAVRNGLASVAVGVLEWMGGLLVAVWLAERALVAPDEVRRARRTYLVVLTSCAALSGLYGIWQYVAPPAWDRMWMEGAAMASIGRPEPFLVRVFGPLNAPGPYAVALASGLLAVSGLRGWARGVAVPPVLVGLLLTLVRSAWGGLVVGVAVVTARLPARQRLVSFGVIVALAGSAWWAVGALPALDTVESRLEGIADLEGDVSYNARLDLVEASGAILANPVGDGVGQSGRAAKAKSGSSSALDNGLLAVLAELGWLGGVLVAVGVGRLLVRLRLATHPEAVACAAIAASIVAQMLFFNTLTGVAGYLFWVSAAFASVGED